MSSDERETENSVPQGETVTAEQAAVVSSAETAESAPPPEAEAVAEVPAESAGTESADIESAAAELEGAPPVEQAAPEAVPAEDSETAAETESPKRRVMLKSAADTSQFKAVPSVGSPAASVPTPVPSTDDVAETETPAATRPQAPPPPPAAEPVELPPKVENLDTQMEAEIEAALAAGPLEPTVNISAEEVAAGGAPISEETLEEGAKLKGKIEAVHGENVFIDLGLRSPGVIPVRQFESKTPEKGQEVKVVVERIDDEEGLIFLNLPRGARKVSGNWDAVSPGLTVDCMVNKTNKGGLEVSIGSLRGFLPAGQVDLRYIEDLEPFIGQKLRVKIVEANRQKRNLIVSRRAILEEDRKDAEEILSAKLKTGQKYAGIIKTIKDYGAFVDIGGVDGFLHIGEISWNRINHPSEVIKEGDEVDVQVISLDPDKKRIGLGMRQLVPNPWADAVDKYAKGTTVSGKVTRVTEFGAFVELEPGMEGLVHISQLAYHRVATVTDVLSVGQEIDLQVLEVDPRRKRIGLSLKALMEKPQAKAREPRKSDADFAPSGGEAYVRTRKGELKGGTGTSGPGGLFGDPKSFG